MRENLRFFWGNMKSGGFAKSRIGVVGSLLGGLYNIARNNEKTYVRLQGQIEIQNYLSNAKCKPQNIDESLTIQKKSRIMS